MVMNRKITVFKSNGCVVQDVHHSYHFSNQMAVWYKTCTILTIFHNKTFNSKNTSDLKSLNHSVVEFSWAKMSKIYDSGTGIIKNAVFITVI